MKIFKLHTKQKLPITIQTAWDFLSNPKNLEDITPDKMNFNITDCDYKKIYPGQIIQYTVTPLLNIPLKWVTEITHVVDKKYFVDEQRFGPYKFWHHKHKFEIIDGGVKIIDILDYSLPFGLIGLFFHPFLVKPKLDEIFKYREKKLIEIFGKL